MPPSHVHDFRRWEPAGMGEFTCGFFHRFPVGTFCVPEPILYPTPSANLKASQQDSASIFWRLSLLNQPRSYWMTSLWMMMMMMMSWFNNVNCQLVKSRFKYTYVLCKKRKKSHLRKAHDELWSHCLSALAISWITDVASSVTLMSHHTSLNPGHSTATSWVIIWDKDLGSILGE